MVSSRTRALETPTRVHAPIRSAIVAVVVLAAISVFSFPTAGSAEPLVPLVLRHAVLTADGTDGYTFRPAQNTVMVRAPKQNSSGNLRDVFWSADAPVQRDATTCATWSTASSGQLQQGAALNIAQRADGSVQAITVTKNVFPTGSWVFNVHVWDSATARMEMLKSFDLESTLSVPGDPPVLVPLPWRVCARTEGSVLRFKAWRVADGEPRWGDARFGGAVLLPPTAPTAGYAGWYAGHLQAGMSAIFADLRVEPGVPAPVSGAVAR